MAREPVNHSNSAEPGSAHAGSPPARLAALFFLMQIYPLLAMFWYHDYPIFSAEAGILILAAAALALLISWLLQRTRPMVCNLVIVVALTLVFMVQFNLFFPGMILVLAVGGALALVFGKRFPALVPFVLAALIVGAWLDNLISPSARLYELGPATEVTGKGPVIHLLMDGFIGPDGLAGDEESQALRSQVTSFFRDYDFKLYTRAYSHYSTTADSMTRLFNFRNDDESIFQRVVLLKEPIAFRDNAWFTALDQSGYKLVVYQTESVDFCSVPLAHPIVCNVFPMPNLKTLHRDLDDPWVRAQVLVRNLASQSMVITQKLRDLRMMGTWGISVHDERLLTRLARDMKNQPGNAYFAHVLLPHSPTIFREDCSIDYGSEPWVRWPHSAGSISNTPESAAIRRARIVPQIKCSLRLLGGLFDELRVSGLYEKATIIVHGDHGTSAYLTRPSAHTMDKLTHRDLQEAYSTLFAVKMPGGSFELNTQTRPLNVLMAKTAAEITGKSMDELGAKVRSEEEPFVYLGGVFPLRQAYVNIFDDPAQAASSVETQAAE